MRSTKGKIEVSRFTGRIKKSTIQITSLALYRIWTMSFMPIRSSFSRLQNFKARGMWISVWEGLSTFPFSQAASRLQKQPILFRRKRKNRNRLPGPHASSSLAHETPPASHGALDVAIEWPRNVWYRDGVSQFETRGAIRVQKLASSSALILSGSITSIRRFYNYFGRAFNIESGEIKFTGTPDNNPLLAIEASYATGAATVYLDISGTPESLHSRCVRTLLCPIRILSRSSFSASP